MLDGPAAIDDYEADGDVDQVDFGMMRRCRTELGGTVGNTFPDGSCDCFDLGGNCVIVHNWANRKDATRC
ncbi:MAG: hypothetical protein GXY55_18610 [Phycisphaerae bacterium]|nr:hypothetical protein [Phycisphaerae bacterium]